MKYATVICALVVIAGLFGCASPSGLVVTHSPNPCDVHEGNIPEGRPFPYMWVYRTEVRNDTDYPIQVTQFEGYFFKNSEWTPVNIMNRTLTAEDFSQWYKDGTPVTNGWIQPHTSAVCDPNWHGVTSPISPRCKWTYDGIDSKGKTYRAEAEIRSVPIK